MHQNEAQVPIRIDFQANQNHSIVGRYMLTTDDREIPFDAAGGNVLVTNAPGSDDRAHNLTVGHTWVMGPAMVNSFRVLANDIYANKPGPQFFGPQDVGINAYTYIPGYMRLIVNNAFRSWQPALHLQPLHENSELRRERRLHADPGLAPIRVRRPLPVDEVGLGGQRVVGRLYTFTGAFTGNAMADFFAGRVGFHRQASAEPGECDATGGRRLCAGLLEAQSGYAELRRGLEPVPADELLRRQTSTTSASTRSNRGVRSTVIPNAPPGFSYPGDPGFEGTVGRQDATSTIGIRVSGSRGMSRGDGRTAVAGRRGHGARLHPPSGPPEHLVGLAVPADGEAAAGREP